MNISLLKERKMNLEVFLQPKMEIKTGKLMGAEALVRCRIGDNLLVPDQFLPNIEKYGSISEIDLFVFEEVCKCLKEWKKIGYSNIIISFNFSRKSLLEDDIVNRIEMIRKKYDIVLQEVEMEITESVDCLAGTPLKSTMRKMNQLGYDLSLDDYGSGYSNLQFLAIIPFKTLKIDKRLIDEILVNKRMEKIIKNTIEFCHEMAISVVAEGIETSEQLKKLRELRCDYGQGFFYNQALPIETFEKEYMMGKELIGV